MLLKVCTACGYRNNEKAKFCSQCGTSLKEIQAEEVEVVSEPAASPPVGFAVPIGYAAPVRQSNQPKMGKMSPVDDTLTMLAEYCNKTVATVGGDGYTEWVLNRCANGTLQLDYYRNYVGYEEEIHHSYPAPDDTWDRITQIKEQYLTGNASGIRLPGMCGGYSLVKIREGDSTVCLTTGNMTAEENTAFLIIKQILTGIPSDKT